MSTDSGKRQFQCNHCQGMITIPANLPATTAPCPLCGQETTSPAPQEEQPIVLTPESTAPSDTRAPLARDAALAQDAPASAEETPVEEEVTPGNHSVSLWVLATIAFLGIICGGYYMVTQLRVDDTPETYVVPTSPEEKVDSGALTLGQSREIQQVKEALKSFFLAKTPEEKAQYIIGGQDRLEDLRRFYAKEEHQDSDLNSENFSIFPLAPRDVERGIVMMDYFRPKQFKFTEFFRPIATLELQRGVEVPKVHIWAGALADNFEMESQRARAFFKKIDGSFKLDWDTLVQTQFRLFREFVDFPESGRTGEFRVFLIEDVVIHSDRKNDIRVFRIADAAYSLDDQVTVEVDRNSEVGKVLEPLAWTDKRDKPVRGTFATVRLRWSSDEEPKLSIDEVMCWEFLGVGGEKGNTSTPPF